MTAALRRSLLAAVAALTGAQAAASRPTNQDIGTWVLACPAANSEPCRLRLRDALLPTGTGTPGAALEVVHRAGAFIPVVALRGLTTQAAIGGMLALQADVALRFDDAPQVALSCGLDGGAIICAPQAAGATNLAAELPAARSALVRIRLSLPGGMTLPEQSRSLDMHGTADALARFRATSPADEPAPAIAGLDWRGFLDRLARDAGIRNGLADLVPNAAAWIGSKGF